jgi:hypothetical protein
MKKVLSAFVVAMVMFVGVGMASALDAVLEWTNTATTYGIQVEKSTSINGTYVLLHQTAPNVSTYTDSSNAPGDVACYRVAYFNASGVGPRTGGVCKSFPTVPTQTPAAFGVN